MIVLIDNYDSFVQNLARYFRRLNVETVVVRHDTVTVAQIEAMRPEAIVISPGPYGPSQTGICLQVVQQLADSIPILGVCLGHQVIIVAYGGTVHRYDRPVHGSASWIEHDGAHEFVGLPIPLKVGRYHSLMADHCAVPDCLEISAWTSDGQVMGVRHNSLPVYGWQFHPESILTPEGPRLLLGFLREAGISTNAAAFQEAVEDHADDPIEQARTSRNGTPVTF